MAATAALDTTIAVVTPENIEFDYQLAGPFRRLPAYLIDVVIRWAIFLLGIALLWSVGGFINMALLSPLMTAATFIAYFIIMNFYGTLLETFYNGRTVGKWSCGIRVIGIDGGPITGKRAFLRNLIRVADLAPYAALSQFDDEIPPVFLVSTGMVGLLSMIVTRRMQRLGDLAAGTMVIVDERNWRLPITKVDDPRVPALASFLPGDYRISRSMARTLAIYAERRHYLTPGRRREIARHLTIPLIARFDFRPEIDPDLLMVALYHKTFLAESSTESADLGPLAGFSPMRRDASRTRIEQGGAEQALVEQDSAETIFVHHVSETQESPH